METGRGGRLAIRARLSDRICTLPRTVDSVCETFTACSQTRQTLLPLSICHCLSQFACTYAWCVT